MMGVCYFSGVESFFNFGDGELLREDDDLFMGGGDFLIEDGDLLIMLGIILLRLPSLSRFFYYFLSLFTDFF